MNKYEEFLKVEYTPVEITDMAKDLARSNQTRASLEQQKKQVDSQLKAQIEEQNTVIGRLSQAIANGCEWRNVECHIELDTPDKGRKRIVRLDTGEEVRIAIMTDQDRQMQLDLQEQAEAAEAEAAKAANGHEPIVTPPPVLKTLPEPEVMTAEQVADAAPLAPAAVMGGTHQRKRKGKDAAAGDDQ